MQKILLYFHPTPGSCCFWVQPFLSIPKLQNLQFGAQSKEGAGCYLPPKQRFDPDQTKPCPMYLDLPSYSASSLRQSEMGALEGGDTSLTPLHPSWRAP